MHDDPEMVEGFRLYRVTRNGETSWVIADGGGWIPGSWGTRAEALAGGHDYSRQYGYASIDDEDEDDV